ncbi:hypothetical protein EDD91_2939 [Streptomyces sp. KS 21]|nr:hypothetical protein EDD91_2939 [Streptomyces sp. KS 21]
METSTALSGPVHLRLPEAPPEPVSGCRDCLHYAVRRANAVSAGDYSKATDVNVALRAHLSETHG